MALEMVLETALELVTLPILADNYVYLLHDPAGRETVLFDAGAAAPVQAALAARGWKLSAICLTHHHDDHIAGVPALVAATGARVYGAAVDAARLPPLDHPLNPGAVLTLAGTPVEVWPVPGHTKGHIAYVLPKAGLAFTGDSLMGAGCGRLFEGTAQQMQESLTRLASLPPETRICSGHEYTAANLRFAAAVEPGNPAIAARAAQVAALRAEGRPSLPVPLADELATNPFLRPASAEIRAHLGLETASALEVFTALRALKDRF